MWYGWWFELWALGWVVNINQQVGLLQARSNFEACARRALKLAPTEHSKNVHRTFQERYIKHLLQVQLLRLLQLQQLTLQLTWGGMLWNTTLYIVNICFCHLLPLRSIPYIRLFARAFSLHACGLIILSLLSFVSCSFLFRAILSQLINRSSLSFIRAMCSLACTHAAALQLWIRLNVMRSICLSSIWLNVFVCCLFFYRTR